MYTQTSAFDPVEIESALEVITAKTVREACMEYIYDKCPAIVGYGEYWNIGIFPTKIFDMQVVFGSHF